MEKKVLIPASGGRKIPALIIYPDAMDLLKPDAIMHIHLHGIGEWCYLPDVMDRLDYLRTNGCYELFNDSLSTYKNKNFILVVPQLYQGDAGGSFDNRNGTWPEWYVNSVYTYMKTIYGAAIDPQRACLSGLSLGGGGVLNYITASQSNARKFSAAVACCPVGIGSGFENISAAKLPVAFYHARYDPTVNVSSSINASAAINSQPDCTIKSKIKIVESIYHSIWNMCFDAQGDPFGNGVNVVDFFINSKFLAPFEMPDTDKWYIPTVSPDPVLSSTSGGILQGVPDPQFLPKPVAIGEASSFGDGLGFLQGVKSTGKKLQYNWTLISGTKCEISNPTWAETYIKNLAPGTFIFQLAIQDDYKRVATTEVKLIIKGAADMDGWLVKAHYSDGSAGVEQLVSKDKVLL